MLNGVSKATASHIYSYDEYGNLIKHQAQSGSTIKTTKASYSDDHNHLASTTDEMDNVTYYCYDPDESTLLWVQYPEDTTGEQGEDGTETIDTRTYYKYDPMYRLENTSSAVNQETSMSAKYTYSGDALTQIQTPSTVYKLDYYDLGLRKSVSVGETPLATYFYTHSTDIDVIDQDKLLKHLDYGNGDVVKYVYDDLGRVTQESYYENGSSTASRTVTYAYDSTGALATTKDSATGRTTKCYYDDVGRVNRQYTTNSSTYHNLYYTYDSLGQITGVRERYSTGSSDSTEENLTMYAYANGRVTALYNDNGTADNASDDVYASYTYDSFDRVEEKTVNRGENAEQELLSETLTYNKLDQVTTLVLDSAGLDRTYAYEYDGNGNITKITYGGQSIRYTYDSQNQLIWEYNPFAGLAWMWTYDEAGNILSKTEYAYTNGTLGICKGSTQYGYTNLWGDLLTSYNGQTISYDAIGNPLSDGTWKYTWEQGRQLSKMSSGFTIWSFTYDANGMRTARAYLSTIYGYTYNGSQLSRMTYGNTVMWFTYGADGKPLSINYNGTTYYYVTNLQGDVVAILNSSGTAVVSYTYDAWGKPLTTTGTMANTLGLHNPLRYRGYVYDRETGLYYLQSRYYNPEWGRFLNADSFVSTGQGLLGNNMFAYCRNNPVANADVTGEIPWLVIGVLAGCAIIGGILGATSDKNLAEGLLGEDQVKTMPNRSGMMTPSELAKMTQSEFDSMMNDTVDAHKSGGLTVGNRIANGLIGAGMGLAVGGAIISVAGVIGSVAVGSATTTITALGGTGLQTFARGALIYDLFAITIAPFWGIEMEPIEYEP